jgi:tRNA (cytosine38-C5)-methyltransferase
MVTAFDNNSVANQCYVHNFGLKPTSTNLEHLAIPYFSKLDADCWLLSPPCQPYTRGGKCMDDEDPRAAALLHLINVLAGIRKPPKWIFVENVLNFESSRSRRRLMEVLAERGYQVQEFLISPKDPWVAIPNDRLRYYLAVCLRKLFHNLLG